MFWDNSLNDLRMTFIHAYHEKNIYIKKIRSNNINSISIFVKTILIKIKKYTSKSNNNNVLHSLHKQIV